MNEFDDMPTIETGLYQHYKGNIYHVFGVGCHTEKQPYEYYVVYAPIEQKAEKVPDYWLRPYDMFMETVGVDGEMIPRFRKLPD